MNNFLYDFKADLQAHDLNPETIEADGKIYTCSTKRHPKNKRQASYCLYEPKTFTKKTVDGKQETITSTTGWFRSFSGRKETFHYSTSERHAPAVPKPEDQARRAAKEAKEATEKAQAQAQATDKALWIWEHSEPCEDHPYLRKKGVSGVGLRITIKTIVHEYNNKRQIIQKGSLVIPFYNGNRLTTLQFIDQDGNKLFLGGAVKKGSYHVINPANNPLTDVLGCEGYATGASLYEAFTIPILVCADSPNALPAVSTFRSEHSETRITYYTDNDAFKAGNAGIQTAKALQKAHSDIVCKKPDFVDVTRKPTDFNDLHNLEGIDAVRRYAPDNSYGTNLDVDYIHYDNYLSESLDLLDLPHGKTLLIADTGAGKTTLISQAVKELHEQGIDALFAVPVTTILDQFVTDLQQAGLYDGFDFCSVRAGDDFPTFHGLIITTYKGAAEKTPADYTPDIMIADEIHYAAEADYMQREIDAVLDLLDAAPHALAMTATPYDWQLDGFDRVVVAEKAGYTPTPLHFAYYEKGKKGQLALDLAIDAMFRGDGQQGIIVRNSKRRNAESAAYRKKTGETANIMDSDEKGENSIYAKVIQDGNTPEGEAFYSTKLYETGLSIYNENISHILYLPNEKHLESFLTPQEVKQGVNRTRRQRPPAIMGIPDSLRNEDDAPFDWQRWRKYFRKRQNELLKDVQAWLDEGRFSLDLFRFHQKDLYPVNLVFVDKATKTARALRSGVNMAITQKYREHLFRFGKFREREFNAHGMTYAGILTPAPAAAPDETRMATAKAEIAEKDAAEFEKQIALLETMTPREVRNEANISKTARKYRYFQDHFDGYAADLMREIGSEDAPYNQAVKWIEGEKVKPLFETTNGKTLDDLLQSFTKPQDAKNGDLLTTTAAADDVQLFLESIPGEHGKIARKRIRKKVIATDSDTGKDIWGDEMTPKAALTFLRNFVDLRVKHTKKDGQRLVIESLTPVSNLFFKATKQALTPDVCCKYFLKKGETSGDNFYSNNVSPLHDFDSERARASFEYLQLLEKQAA